MAGNDDRALSPEAAWRLGADLAIDLVDEAVEIGLEELALHADARDGRPQTNVVLRYLDKLREVNDRRVDAAFGALLSDYLGSYAKSWLSRQHLQEITRLPIATTAEAGHG
jgi:hypothetical protein